MSVIISLNELSYYSSNTSNSISNRITNLYTNDLTFQQNVTVNNDMTIGGNLTVDGNTTSINTDSYTTEILEIVSTNVNDEQPVLKIVESGSVGNIVEVYKGVNEVLSIDNSGKLITSDVQVNGAVTTTGTINGASATEISQLVGIGTTTIATQLNAKQATITGAATTITSANLTANRVLYSDGDGKIRASGPITATELNYLDGVSDNIQTQLNGKQGTLSSTTDVTVKQFTANGQITVYDAGITTSASAWGADDNKIRIRSTPLLTDGSPNELVLGVATSSRYWGVAYIDTAKGGVAAVTPLSFRVNGSEKVRIIESGNVGIGTTAPTEKLEVNGNLKVGNVTVTGDITATGNITAYYSDERLKTKISDIVDPLEKIEKLNGFYYKPNELANSLGVKHTDVEIGLSAQDVQKVLPEIIRLSPLDCDYANNEQISKSGENYLTLSYERIVPLLVESIKDLNKNNKLLLEEINSIKQKIDLN